MFTNFCNARWDISTFCLFLKSTNFIFLQDDMAPTNTVSQASRKAIQSTSQGSTMVSTASGGVMTRIMAKAVAIIAIGQSVVMCQCSHVRFKILALKFLRVSTSCFSCFEAKICCGPQHTVNDTSRDV